jgi:hypothetical protein
LQAASGSLPEIETKVVALTTQLGDAVAANQKEVSNALAENVLLIRNSVQSASQDFSKINEELKAKVVALTTQLGDAVTSNQKEVNNALAENALLIRNSIHSVGQDFSKLHDDLKTNVVTLTTQLGDAVAANQKEVSKALAENVLLMRNSVQSVGQDFGKINEDFNKHLGDTAGKMREQVAVLDAALTEELKKSLESLGRQLAALSEKFVSDYSPLTDKPHRLVAVAAE